MARLVSIALIWGVNNIFAKLTLEWLPPLLTVALRFVIVLAALALFLRPMPKIGWKSIAAMLLLVGPIHFGIQYTGLALAHDLAPMVVAMQLWIPCSVLFAGLILGERIGGFRLAGIGMAFLGIIAMFFDPIVFAQGFALALVALAAASYALGTVLVRRIGAAMDPWAMQGWIALAITPAMLAGSFTLERGQLEAMAAAPWHIWAFIVFGSVASSLVANAFMFELVRKYEVSRITPYLLLTPLLSFILAAIVLKDAITWRIALGGAVTLAGVTLVAMSERRLKAS